MMKRRQWMVAAVMAVSTISTMSVQAAQEAPDELVKRISNEVLAAIKADPFFADFLLVRQGRLSVVPVTPEQWERLLSMEG